VQSNPFYYGFEEQLIVETGLNYQGNFFVYVAADGVVYPDNFYAGDFLYPSGNLTEESFDVIWERVRDAVRVSNYEKFECAGCPVDAAGIFCDFRSAALSLRLHGKPNVCGADDTEKETMLMRWSAREEAQRIVRPEVRQFDNF
jgi:MoaA/NifB/PqqE/SkfB family radical SAM enzyme